MREGIVESLENKDYNKLYKQDKQEVLDSIKKAKQNLKLKTDKKNSWKYYDVCEQRSNGEISQKGIICNR